MKEVLNVFLIIIFEFIIELYVFIFLSSARLEKRKNFVLREVLSFLALLIVGFGVSWLYPYIGDVAVGRIAIYLLLFALATLQAWLCFKEEYRTVLFCCGMAYAAQNFTYKLFVLFWGFGEQARLFENWNDNFFLFYHIIYYAFFIAAAAGVYFSFIRPVTKKLAGGGEYNNIMLTSSVAALAVTIILCSVEDVFFAKFADGRENSFASFDIFVLRQSGNVLSLLCLAAVLFLISLAVTERNLKNEVEYLQHTIRQGEWQYKMNKDIVDMINVKCHDIKYKINSYLAGGGLGEQAIKELNESVAIYDTAADAGNPILNVMLSEKRLYCEQNGITFSCMADGAGLKFMSDGDMYSLFGNILDNALEAVEGVWDKQKKVIDLVVKRAGGMILIQEENYFNGERKFVGGLPETTKGDKNYHGFGMKSIGMIVRKYDGDLTVQTEGDVFRLSAVIPER